MASINALMKLKSTIILIILIVSSNSIPKTNSSRVIVRSVPTVTRMTFFFHDQNSGKQPTVLPVFISNKSQTLFGSIFVADNLLTAEMSPKSTVLGRGQGIYGGASQKTFALFMFINFVFTEKSEFNGSTLTLLGRNDIFTDVREMSIVGGTGVFRLAQGFVEASTVFLNTKLKDAIVEYNVTVIHYN